MSGISKSVVVATPKAKWECFADTRGFVEYSDDVNAVIEAAWQTPSTSSVSFRHRAQQYVLNFGTMTQRNVSTKRERPVRRAARTTRTAAVTSSLGEPRRFVSWFTVVDGQLATDVSSALEHALATLRSNAAVTSVSALNGTATIHVKLDGVIAGTFRGAPATYQRSALVPPLQPVITAPTGCSLVEDETFSLANAPPSSDAPTSRQVPPLPFKHPSQRYFIPSFSYAETPYEGFEYMIYPKCDPTGTPLREPITFSVCDIKPDSSNFVYDYHNVIPPPDHCDELHEHPWYDYWTVRKKRVGDKIAALNATNRAFLVHDFLTSSECSYIIDAASKHVVPLDAHFPQQYRKSNRAMIASRTMAQELYLRILPHLTKNEVGPGLIPLCFGHGGVWYPHGCNEAIKINRYDVGGMFVAHRDGPWIPWEDMASVYTLLVYLNDDYEGGETEFVDGPTTGRQEPSPTALVRPERGMALVFNHEAWHAGRAVVKGKKYLLRTEIIFVRPRGLFSTADRYLYGVEPDYGVARALYEKSQAASKEGNSAEFVELYQQVVAMQRDAKLAQQHDIWHSVGQQRILHRLPEEVLSEVLGFLSDRDLALLFSVNKAMYYVMCYSSVWMHKFRRLQAALLQRDAERDSLIMHPTDIAPAYVTLDWLLEYQRLRNPRSMQPVVVTFGGLHTHVSHSFAATPSRMTVSDKWFNSSSLFTWQRDAPPFTQVRLRGVRPYQRNWRTMRLDKGCVPLRGIEPYHMNMMDYDRFITRQDACGVCPLSDTLHLPPLKDAPTQTAALVSVEWVLVARALAGVIELETSPIVLVVHPAWYYTNGRTHWPVRDKEWKGDGDYSPGPPQEDVVKYRQFTAISMEERESVTPSRERLAKVLDEARRDLFAATNTPAIACVNASECVAFDSGFRDAIVVTTTQYSTWHRLDPDEEVPAALCGGLHYSACYVSVVRDGVEVEPPRVYFTRGADKYNCDSLSTEAVEARDCGDSMSFDFVGLVDDAAFRAHTDLPILVAHLDQPWRHQNVHPSYEDDDDGDDEDGNDKPRPDTFVDMETEPSHASTAPSEDMDANDDPEEDEQMDNDDDPDEDEEVDEADKDESKKAPAVLRPPPTPPNIKLAIDTHPTLYKPRTFRERKSSDTFADTWTTPVGVEGLLSLLTSAFGDTRVRRDAYHCHSIPRGASKLVATPGFKSKVEFRPEHRVTFPKAPLTMSAPRPPLDTDHATQVSPVAA